MWGAAVAQKEREDGILPFLFSLPSSLCLSSPSVEQGSLWPPPSRPLFLSAGVSVLSLQAAPNPSAMYPAKQVST